MNKKNTYFKRNIFEKLKKWIDRKEILAIKGPRQSGKTTLLKMLEEWLINDKKVKKENIIFITFEDRNILEKFKTDPKEYIQSIIKNNNEKIYIFIDEFQYLENGGQILKLLFDTVDNVKFIITGSSSLELVNQTSKFLVGRVFYLNLWQFNFEEFLQIRSPELIYSYKKNHELIENFIFEGKDFLLPNKEIWIKEFEKYFLEYATYGSYPATIMSDDIETKRTVLKNIYETYVMKDVIDLLKVKNFNQLKDLISILSAQIGNVVNYNNLAQDTRSYFKEIKNNLNILEETFIISVVPPYFSNKISELKKNPKIYFIDIGLRNFINGYIDESNIVLRPDLGAIMENAVFSQMMFNEKYESIKYWRTTNGAEVDFVVCNKEKNIPIEIKFSHFSTPKISRSFHSFIEKYNPKQALVLTKNFWGELKVKNTKIKFVPLWYV